MLQWCLLVNSKEKPQVWEQLVLLRFQSNRLFFSGYWQLPAACPCLWLRGWTVVKWIRLYCLSGFNQCPASTVCIRDFPLPFNCSGCRAVDGAKFLCSYLDWSVFNSELILLCRMPPFGSLIHARTAVAMVISLSANLLFAETLSVPLRRYGILTVF